MQFRMICYPLLFTLVCSWAPRTGDSKPLAINGHSHNDYQHKRPLWDAIENKFISIEVDIHLIGKALLVGHDEEDLSEGLTLQSLYLDPLRSYINAHAGWVYPNQELTLLLDIKSSPEPTYQILRTELAKFSDILTTYASDHIERRAVSIVISGNRPRESMLNEDVRYATYDGRLEDLNKGISPTLMALISDNWEDHFEWRGKGPMPMKDRNKLGQITAIAHSKGYRVRFWNLPTSARSKQRAVWSELISLGVDLISVDDLSAYQAFLADERALGEN